MKWPPWNTSIIVIGVSPESSRILWNFMYCLLIGNFCFFCLFLIDFLQFKIRASWQPIVTPRALDRDHPLWESLRRGGYFWSWISAPDWIFDLVGGVAALSHETALKSFVKKNEVFFPYSFVSFFLFQGCTLLKFCWKGLLNKLGASKSQTEPTLKTWGKWRAKHLFVFINDVSRSLQQA